MRGIALDGLPKLERPPSDDMPWWFYAGTWTAILTFGWLVFKALS